MKPSTTKALERRLWGKMAMLFIFMGILSYLIAHVIDCFIPLSISPTWLSIVLVIMCFICFPLLMKFSSPSGGKTTKEFKRMNKDFEKTGDNLILRYLGSKELEMLFLEEGNWIPMNAIDICRQLLEKEQSRKIPLLRFYLYAKLAKYYTKDRQIKAAVQTLHNALALEPADLIANFRLAALYERIGSGDDANAHYQSAMARCVSDKLKEYIGSQIQRVKMEGPHADGPYDGSGRQWIS